MHVGKIIDVVYMDYDNKLNPRRVRIREVMRPCKGFVHVVGENVRGDNPVGYRLPLSPIKSLGDLEAGRIHWLEVPDEEVEE